MSVLFNIGFKVNDGLFILFIAQYTINLVRSDISHHCVYGEASQKCGDTQLTF